MTTYDPIPHLTETVGHLEARRVEINERLSAYAAPYYEQVLQLPDESEDQPEPAEGSSYDESGINLNL